MPAEGSALARADLARFFAVGGPLAAALPSFEARPGQLRMAECLREALLERRTALVEAPTGTGKSLAYLIPALLAGERVVIATANKSLQHQLFAKDLPLAARALGRAVDAVLVKGRSNYLCSWKWERELREQSLLAEIDPDHGPRQALAAWLRETESGDIDELPFLLSGELRGRSVSFPDDCLHQDCAYWETGCWVNRMRDRAFEAQVLITNHHLLLTALQLGEVGERILPPADIYIVDEAHHLVDTATAVFEVEVTDQTLPLLLARRVFRDQLAPNEIDDLRVESSLAFEEAARMGSPDGRPRSAFRLEAELPRLRELAGRLKRLAKRLEDQNPQRRSASRPPSEVLASTRPAAEAAGAADAAESGASPTPEDVGGLIPAPWSEREAEERAAARLFELAISGLSGLADRMLAVASDRHDGALVRYAEPAFGRQVRLSLRAAPIAPAEQLADCLFGGAKRAVVCTSATLAAGGDFAHFKARCGIQGATVELVAPPVFDYPNQALLYQPALEAYRWDARSDYFAAAAGEIARLVELSRGRALCLFTSWQGLQAVRERLAPVGEGAGPVLGASAAAPRLIWPLRAQGDAPRDRLLDWFRDTPHAVLLATRSFWEGVDIPGEELSLVVLDKLPFPSPQDPLHRARMDALEQAGESSFGAYMLPLMTLTLKQGFGRLIRRAEDRGVVAILDERLTSKGYGQRARRDLPPARFTRDLAEVHRFFRALAAVPADFALSARAWPEPGPLGQAGGCGWWWRLSRLGDGSAHGLEGRDPDAQDPAEAELQALVAGLDELDARIARAGRARAEFAVELRCGPRTLVLAEALAQGRTGLGAAWAAARDGWGAVGMIGVPVEDGEGLAGESLLGEAPAEAGLPAQAAKGPQRPVAAGS